MYSVSEEYKKAIRQRVVNDRIGGSVTLSDGTSLTVSDRTLVKNSLKISHELCGEYRIGTFHIGCLRIAFFDDGALLRDFSGARIEPYYEIETAAGWERVPLGVYYADGNSVRRKRNTVSLTAYDGGCFFDRAIPEERRTLSGNARRLIEASCGDCGVVFGGIPDALPNGNVSLSAGNTQVQTYRDLIAWCAELLCAYAVIDREGKLWFRSAKYGVSETDRTDILIDKYLTAEERDSIYVTDTRAYLQTVTGYSGGVLKTYVSDAVQTDEQAAPAGYAFGENPLLPETVGEEERDGIHTARLAFMDGFKQRGIEAEIFGDPALDAGDVLRCAGGDIDQRRSVVGLVTKQEWRYRNLHTVVCAAPPLLGRDAASAAVVSGQTQKKLDALSLSSRYAPGAGITIEGKEISLKPAKKWNDFKPLENALGGVYVNGAGGLDVDYDGLLYVKNANTASKGGIRIGAGLVAAGGWSDALCSVNLGKGMTFNPLSDEEYANKLYCGRSISPKLGDGLTFIEYGEEEEPGADDGALTLYLGEGLTFTERETLTDADGEPTGEFRSKLELKLGEGLRFGEKGELIAEGGAYKAGENITIAPDGTISAEIPESADGVSIAQAVVIKESDAKYLLHDFTEIEYSAGNRIGYAGPGNQIVVQGYIAYPYAVLNEGTNSSGGSKWYYSENGVPNFSRYSEISADFYSNTAQAAFKKSYLKQTVTTPNAGTYSWFLTRTDDVDLGQATGILNNSHWSGIGLLLEWLDIYPPGYTVGNKVFENGCANIRFHYIRKSNTNIANDQIYERTRVNTNYIAPFASLTEYQAAVGLTYEPVTLTRVEDNPTVVAGK